MADKSFYQIESQNFRNSVYAFHISLEEKLTDEYLKGESNRLVYTKSNFALRKRSIGSQSVPGQLLNNLNLPFINYKVKDIKPFTKRPWFNIDVNVNGIYIEELARNLRIQPITIEYDATFWLYRDDDMQYIFQKLSFDNAVETIVPYYIQILGQDIKMFAVVEYQLQYSPVYDEQEWLKFNNIHTIVLDFKVQTFYILDNIDICIPNKLLFTFSVMHEVDDYENLAVEDLHSIVINHYTEENIES